ncbi:ABC transporter ATP-binding protein [Corynebacterium pacaense]|uniref:ABC transporter ATP-binding protein n=1 Tax=Corynebacterium pacaense TaxID=1816684 RepID=UPI0009BB566A|nr:ABC transporter ATP-binding protein [Corynebacterium pacaense]
MTTQFPASRARPGTSAGPSDSAIEVRNVVKSFGEITAVNGLSFSVARGSVFALLGPNGAGKTTTIEMCEGFTAPTSGEIRVLGIDPATHPDQVRRRIGIMLQGGGSYNSIRVTEMLRLAASYNDNPLDPEWLLDVVGLRNVGRTPYRRLSGGQQQRLSLALALISRPEIIFLDEPTAGMDTQSRNMVWSLINDLRRDGVTVVLSTHLMDEAEALADHVLIIDHGRILAEGTPEELTIRDQEQGGQVAIETSTALDTDLLLQALAAAGLHHVTVRSGRPMSYVLRVEPTPAALAVICAAVADQGVLIRALSTNHRSLEDVFLDITGRELRS